MKLVLRMTRLLLTGFAIPVFAVGLSTAAWANWSINYPLSGVEILRYETVPGTGNCDPNVTVKFRMLTDNDVEMNEVSGVGTSFGGWYFNLSAPSGGWSVGPNRKAQVRDANDSIKATTTGITIKSA